jgi:starch phosphorylase
MLAEYLDRLYLPAAQSYRMRTAHDLRVARDLKRWLSELREHWSSLHWGNLTVDTSDDRHLFSVQVYFGEIVPDSVAVELYAEPTAGAVPERHPMRREQPLSGAAGGYRYVAEIPATRPANEYTPRVVPAHEAAFIPVETPLIRWYSA